MTLAQCARPEYPPLRESERSVTPDCSRYGQERLSDVRCCALCEAGPFCVHAEPLRQIRPDTCPQFPICVDGDNRKTVSSQSRMWSLPSPGDCKDSQVVCATPPVAEEILWNSPLKHPLAPVLEVVSLHCQCSQAGACYRCSMTERSGSPSPPLETAARSPKRPVVSRRFTRSPGPDQDDARGSFSRALFGRARHPVAEWFLSLDESSGGGPVLPH